VTEETERSRRRAWVQGPDGQAAEGWLRQTDDDLLYHIESLPAGHDCDHLLIEVVRSHRHFFIRQEAAKKIRNQELLKEHSQDRHIGQILVRGLNRREDVTYLERLAADSRHLEVRKAAEAQLRAIAERILAQRDANRPSGEKG
jgi:hypothetical protein